MGGASFPNSRLAQFEEAIEAGHVLVMVDVPEERVAAIEKLVEGHHPEIEIETFEPRTPVVAQRGKA
jgi:hypothetical protein